ncbi:uncharacterized protein [Procambarus clarkii]|uniref:uncharacterized protein n=1 Tax=Procambarus clarkii TaxID=6728 RepID=UPI001E671238|nr:uncharacterized protein LOC123768673 [Procambarus clarkii]
METNILHLGTYMCPGIPVEYYEFIAEYLEKELCLQTTLLYNSRSRGPDISRGDHQRIDLAFVTTSAYLENFKSGTNNFQLLPVGAVTKHPVKGEVLGYYTDIVVHRDIKERISEFLDLRGCKFVYAHEGSLSSNTLMLRTLKQMGEDASFFSDIQVSGNHMSSIEMVVSKKAEAAAVDSLSFANYLNRHYYQAPEIHLQGTWGPLPPHPILVNSNLPDAIKIKIQEALLNMNKLPKWKKMLNSFCILGFRKTSSDNYLEAADHLDATKSLSFGITYY